VKKCDLFTFKGKFTYENESTPILEIVGNRIPNCRGQGNVVDIGTAANWDSYPEQSFFHLQTYPYWPWDAPNFIFN
jgi:hypothetical protein